MANKFVWSGATGANNGSSWQDAYISLMRDWGAEGMTPATDFVYVRSVHAESTGSTLTIAGSTAEGATACVRVICVVGDTTGTTPGNLATGASVVSTVGDCIYDEGLYVYGVDFDAEDDHIFQSGTDVDLMFEQCSHDLSTATATDKYNIGGTGGAGQRVIFLDCTWNFGNVAQDVDISGGVQLTLDNCTVPDALTKLFNDIDGDASIVTLRNCDLSAMSGIIITASLVDVSSQFSFRRCVLHASATLVSGNIDVPGVRVEFLHCQVGTDADPAYQMAVYTREGVVSADTASYRSRGAVDGDRTTEISWDMDTTVGSVRSYPGHALESPPIVAFIPGDGSTEYTARAYIASGGTQQDDDCWMDLTRVNHAATSSLGVRDTTRVAPETAAANYPTDTLSSWVGADVGTKQYMEKAFTPDKPGALSGRFYMASTGHIFMDPLLEVRDSNGNLLTRRAWIDPETGGQIMEFTAPRAQYLMGVM